MVEYANPEVARRRLVETVLPAAGVRDPRVLRALGRVPREIFLEEALRLRAYEDTALPIGYGQTISQPSTVGRVLQALGLRGTERVLEVGTGSGYQTALLALLAERVFTVERIPALARGVWPRLERLRIWNVALRTGDGTYGWPDEAPFDAVVVAAASPRVPERLYEQLGPGGRMVLPLETPGGGQRLVRVSKGEGGPVEEELEACRFVGLVGRFQDRGAGPAGEGHGLGR